MKGLSLTNVKKPTAIQKLFMGLIWEIDRGEFIVSAGPSGCGKSTLLRMIAGLEDITSGDLNIEGARVNDVPAAMRELPWCSRLMRFTRI